MIAGHEIPREIHGRLMQLRLLPGRLEISQHEAAERLDLGIPQLQALRDAVGWKDGARVRRELPGYLDSCLFPAKEAVRFPVDWYATYLGDIEDTELLLRGKAKYVGKVLELGDLINWHAYDYPVRRVVFRAAVPGTSADLGLPDHQA